MASLSQKFYGTREESGTEQDRKTRLENLKKEQYGVTYTATKFFINRTMAEAFFKNIEKNTALIKKNPKTGERVVIKER